MSGETDPPRPFDRGSSGELLLLRVEGRELQAGAAVIQWFMPFILVLGTCIMLSLADRLAIEGTIWNPGAVVTSILVTLLFALVLGGRWSARLRRHRGPILFTEQGVRPGLAGRLIPWPELLGYSTATSDGLIELSHGERGRLVVPTIGHAERDRVVGLLEARGIPRLD